MTGATMSGWAPGQVTVAFCDGRCVSVGGGETPRLGRVCRLGLCVHAFQRRRLLHTRPEPAVVIRRPHSVVVHDLSSVVLPSPVRRPLLG